jgi:glycosyltransferase involved in cell wall biosynthesis
MQTQKHILSVFSTFATGGPQIRFCALANHFGPAIRHSIVAMDGNLAAQEKLDPALSVDFPNPGLKPRDSFGNIARIVGFLRRADPHLLITSNWGSMDWAAARNLTRTPHIHLEDGFGPEERSSQLPRRVLTRRLALRGSETIVPSQTLLHIAKNVWRLPPNRLHYIPNGIDTARFQNAKPASLPPGDGKVIGTIAALRPEKNLSRLIRAFRLVRNEIPARLVIVGDGPERTALQTLAQDIDLSASCHFAGHSTAPETWLAAFDIFALSSDTEQMPLSILEAAAAGLPVAAIKVGDIAAMLAPENQPYLTAPDDAALAKAIVTLMADPAAKTIGAANAARTGKHFSIGQMYAAYRQFLLL